MKLKMRSIAAVSGIAFSLGVLILGFQNCAQNPTFQEAALSGSLAPDVHTQRGPASEASLPTEVTKPSPEKIREQSEDRFQQVSDRMLTSQGELISADWGTRAEQLKELSENITDQTQPHAVALAKEVLKQLMASVGDREALTPDQQQIISNSMTLISYSIYTRDDISKVRAYVSEHTDNPQLAEEVSRQLGPIF